uniref:Orf-O n=1 Tax=Streptococcus gordonii TaxID=1302 RepID=P95763_STRGN|nr:Orf-O [Streptococcus gordonii]
MSASSRMLIHISVSKFRNPTTLDSAISLISVAGLTQPSLRARFPISTQINPII